MWQFIQEGAQRVVAGDAGTISLVGMSSVFSALILLAVFMAALGQLFQARDAGRLPAGLTLLLGGTVAPPPQLEATPAPEAAPEEDADTQPDGIPAGVLAAIATAIALDLEATSQVPARPATPLSSWRLSARRLQPRPRR